MPAADVSELGLPSLSVAIGSSTWVLDEPPVLNDAVVDPPTPDVVLAVPVLDASPEFESATPVSFCVPGAQEKVPVGVIGVYE